MTRKDFIAKMGTGSGLLILASCLGGCDKDSPSYNPTDIDFTIDLSAADYVALTVDGGYMTFQDVIVARTLTGTFIAVSVKCTHGGAPIVFQSSTTDFACLKHGATFDRHGAVTHGPATSDLVEYKTTLTGTKLRVFS